MSQTARAENWFRDAACRGKPFEWFVPADHMQRNYAQGREVCMACPVRATCLEYAMSTETRDDTRVGLWGGLTGDERVMLARKRRAG